MKVSDFFNPQNKKQTCSHDMFGNCRKGPQCRYTHIDKTRPINDLIFHLKDPSKLISRRELIKALNKKFKTANQYYITTCTFKIQGNACRNECQGRCGSIKIKYNGENLNNKQ